MQLWTDNDVKIQVWRAGVQYAPDPKRWPPDARYKLADGLAVAWFVLGWQIETDEDTEWTGTVHQTDNVLAVMVGDDRVETFDPDDLVEIDEFAYCSVCGQIGCCHDGR